jgi:DNA processing protein
MSILGNTLPLDQLMYWIAFSRVVGIGPIRFQKLLTFFQDDMASAWRAASTDLSAAGLDRRTINTFLQQRTSIVPEQELERLERLRIQVITWRDTTYPPLLKKIEHAPYVLYVCGTLTEDDRRYTIGIVGTRRMTSYGHQVTEHFASELVAGKITIVSGLALGVDTVAHMTALDRGGRTLAIIASGLDVIYPAANYQLARRIVESGQGALVTSFPLGVKPDARNFPARNHIISGLSLGILVTEAPLRSGALITAMSALNHGREVFAVPNSIFAASSVGVNKLIHDGAHPVTDVQDILSSLNLHILPVDMETQATPANAEERTLLQSLSHEARHIDDIIRDTGLPTPTVTATLTVMELKGLVKQVGTMHYISVR